MERPRDQLERNQASHGSRRPAEVLGGVGQVHGQAQTTSQALKRALTAQNSDLRERATAGLGIVERKVSEARTKAGQALLCSFFSNLSARPAFSKHCDQSTPPRTASWTHAWKAM